MGRFGAYVISEALLVGVFNIRGTSSHFTDSIATQEEFR